MKTSHLGNRIWNVLSVNKVFLYDFSYLLNAISQAGGFHIGIPHLWILLVQTCPVLVQLNTDAFDLFNDNFPHNIDLFGYKKQKRTENAFLTSSALIPHFGYFFLSGKQNPFQKVAVKRKASI